MEDYGGGAGGRLAVGGVDGLRLSVLFVGGGRVGAAVVVGGCCFALLGFACGALFASEAALPGLPELADGVLSAAGLSAGILSPSRFSVAAIIRGSGGLLTDGALWALRASRFWRRRVARSGMFDGVLALAGFLSSRLLVVVGLFGGGVALFGVDDGLLGVITLFVGALFLRLRYFRRRQIAHRRRAFRRRRSFLWRRRAA